MSEAKKQGFLSGLLEKSRQHKGDIIGFCLSILIPFFIGGIIMALLGHNPFQVYAELFKGAFVGSLNFGTTLEKFTTILLIGVAFNLSMQVKFFNLGMEGCLYMGALFSAYVGFSITGLPAILHIPLCLAVGALAGAAWAFVPGYFKIHYNVSEACSTIMLNYIAIYFTSFMVNFVWSAKTSVPQTPYNQDSARLFQFMKPSRANIGLFIAIAVFVLVYWLVTRSTVGYKIRNVGTNKFFADYVGIGAKKVALITVLCSGAIAGLAGSIEVAGMYGTFMDQFAVNLVFDGLMASMVVRNKMKYIPISAFFIAVLKAGSMGMERNTGVSRALVDTIITTLILLVAMDTLFNFSKRIRKKKKKNQSMPQAPSTASAE